MQKVALTSLRLLIAKPDEPSWMVAAYPDLSTKDRLKKYVKCLCLEEAERVFPPTEWHITLRYWKQLSSLVLPVKSWLERHKVLFRAVSCHPTGMDIFGDEGSLVIRLENDVLSGIQETVDVGIQDLGVPPSNYPNFKPHLTVAEGMKKVQHKPPPFPIQIDRYALVTREDRVLWEVNLNHKNRLVTV